MTTLSIPAYLALVMNATAPNATPVTMDQVTEFVAAINAKFPQAMRVWHAKPGRRYAQVVTHNRKFDGSMEEVFPPQVSGYGFVDMATGDFLKAASYKVPAKGARGNLHKGTALAWAGEYGVAHLR